jgi:hypothetical protein
MTLEFIGFFALPQKAKTILSECNLAHPERSEGCVDYIPQQERTWKLKMMGITPSRFTMP